MAQLTRIKMGNTHSRIFLFTPVKNVWMVAEAQWGERQNFSDGFSSNATKIQFSFKYSFGHVFYKNKSE